jgi:hypothetical protein
MVPGEGMLWMRGMAKQAPLPTAPIGGRMERAMTHSKLEIIDKTQAETMVRLLADRLQAGVPCLRFDNSVANFVDGTPRTRGTSGPSRIIRRLAG